MSCVTTVADRCGGRLSWWLAGRGGLLAWRRWSLLAGVLFLPGGVGVLASAVGLRRS